MYALYNVVACAYSKQVSKQQEEIGARRIDLANNCYPDYKKVEN
jgi:hypothetical protein